MAGITGQGTTFNLPNYVGELFLLSPTDTPFLSAIGGLTGGKQAKAKLFEWETYDLRDAAADRQRLEGAEPPTAAERVRAYVSNVVEIHQEQVSVSYTKQAAVGQLSDSVIAEGSNPIVDELGWQTAAALKQIARDVETSFINGTYASPSDNTSPRKTRGLIQAIATNVNALGGAALTVEAVLDTMQDAWESGGLQEGETRTCLVGATQKRALTQLFIRDQNFRQTDRNVGGVNVTVIETDFGDLNVMLDRYMPSDTLAFVSMEDCAPVFLQIPGKGFLFAEPMAKTAASDEVQIYGEIGLEYGNEQKHAKITGAATGSSSS